MTGGGIECTHEGKEKDKEGREGLGDGGREREAAQERKGESM